MKKLKQALLFLIDNIRQDPEGFLGFLIIEVFLFIPIYGSLAEVQRDHKGGILDSFLSIFR